MSETIDDENSPLINDSTIEQDQTVEDMNHSNDNEETWFYKNNQSKNTDNPSQEFDDDKEKSNRSLIIGFDDDSDDEDDIQVTIRNYEPDISTFQINRQQNRPISVSSKPFSTRTVDIDAQGIINGQSTFDHDITTAYKDDEKPWKKPGADITDYFNYGFTEEIWTQYCDRQRRLRAENNLARMNMNHMPPMGPMNPMLYPMNIRPMTMINRPMNMQMVPRPMNTQPPNGKIGVIGSTDRTSRRSMYETPGGFEYQPFPSPTDGQNASTNPNSTPPVNNTHQIPTLGAQRLPMMNLPRGMPYRPPFIGSQFLPQGPVLPNVQTDRVNLSQPYFIPTQESNINENPRQTSSRSPTPEQDRSKDSRSRHHHRSSPTKHRSHEYERPRDEKSDYHSRKRHHQDEYYHRSKRSRRDNSGDNDDDENHHRRSRHRSSDNKNQNIE